MPNGTVVDWCRSVCGNGIGTILLLGLAGKILLDGMLELRIFSEIICRFMLPATPVWVLSLVLLLVAGCACGAGNGMSGKNGGNPLFSGRNSLAFWCFWPWRLLRSMRVFCRLPLPSPSGIGAGLAEMSIVFRGLVFLYFIYPDLKKPVGFAVWKICLLITAVVTVIVLRCLANYGEGMLAAKLLPTLQMLERVSFTGVFLTRQDLLLLWFWMASAVLFLSGVVFFGSLLGTQLCRQAEKKRKLWLWVVLAALFALSFLPESLMAAQRLRLAVSPWLNLAYLVGLPVLLLLAWQEGREKGCIKNLFCWRWQSPFF